MKKGIFITLLFTFCFALVNGQVVEPEKVVKKQGTRRANNKIERGVDKGFDKLEEGIGSLFGKKKKKKKAANEESKITSGNNEDPNRNDGNNSNEGAEKQVAKKPDVVWNKFDFVPGDVVIFEDGPAITEENGEFPSRWDLVKGQVEIASVNGENVMMFMDGTPAVVPYLKNASEDYLPEVFTVEFDFYKPVHGNRFSVYLYDIKNQRNSGQEIEIGYKHISVENSNVSGEHPNLDYTWNDKARWIHVSIAYTKGKLKVYMDDTRLINIPHYEANPTGICLQAYWAELSADKAYYVKNVRIAKGGVKYYDRVLQNGKIICNGIRFDVNKASLKPESMGPINEIFQLLQKQPDLNFSIEGHTDSDGDDASNKSLSEARAKVVMEKLIQMGISSNRLSYAGYGESKPLDNNSTPEGKANNRRVEFVKVEGIAAAGNPKTSGNSIFDSLDRNAIDTKMNSLQSGSIEVANQSGVVLQNGTTIIYGTSDGYLGKMEVLDVDESDNYKLTVRYVTYNDNGSVHSKSDHLEIGGSYTCDLDKGKTEDLISSEEDFWLNRPTAKEAKIEQLENTGFYVVPN
ncbi:OmpA family protein [Labilibaculum sp. K2S]|uniref:OmpA family protein n=1 Tax=Labilibaculum sp. K2S TaxID=3056386 RepID=UPI0025A4266B|nr:OmpA family protein [Labilibaculum sp. K2S]MDM8159018.1 OmpA family protein [Labilibaculum sp. K2S]